MALFNPYYNSDDLIAAVKRKISFPVSQQTFSDVDILLFANEEMFISQVPSMMEYHQEYFAYKCPPIALVPNQNNYPFPDRSIGMRLRDVFYADSNNNLYEMTRVNQDDRAYFQNSTGANESINKFFVQGNDVVLVPEVGTGATGSLVFVIWLRPNQLVPTSRAATVQAFTRTIAVTNSNIFAGDTITVGSLVFTAVASGATGLQFNIGASDIATATNIVTAINNNATYSATNGNPTTTNVVQINYSPVSTSILTSNASAFAIQTTQGILFNQVPSTYTDPQTNVSTPLFVNGAPIDFLETKGGHRIRSFDVPIPMNGISGNIINFPASVVPQDLVIGDYICLANECIIPGVPSDLHNALAERTCARILAAIGDQAGLQAAQVKIADIEKRQGNLLDDRVEGTPQKVLARNSLLHFGRMSRYRRL